MRIVYQWLGDFVRVPGDPDSIADAIALRGFEVAGVQHGRYPVIDFEITANRPDCLSHRGIAREAAAIWNTPLQTPAAPPPAPADGAMVQIDIEDPALCPRYCGQVFDVRVGRSPDWLTDRLEAAQRDRVRDRVRIAGHAHEVAEPLVDDPHGRNCSRNRRSFS